MVLCNIESTAASAEVTVGGGECDDCHYDRQCLVIKLRDETGDEKISKVCWKCIEYGFKSIHVIRATL